MFVIRLMGLADVLAAVSLFILRWDVGKLLAVGCLAYLVFKSFRYLKDLASALDFLAALTIGAALLGYYGTFSYIMVVWLLQKGLRSLF